MKRCEVCCETESKYQCPRCDIKTCCLVCVKQHKVNTGCNGQRDKTAYVKLSEFSDRNLLNDYRFLEDTGRKNNNAGRDILKRKHNRPNFLRELEKQAGIRNVNLRLMPYPMSRRKNNSTSYQHRLKKMYWQIEWVFAEVDLTLIDKRLCEDDTLESILMKHINVDGDPIIRHKLKPYITSGMENWSLFMKYEDTTVDKPLFYKMDMTQSLLENFRYKHILEYPSIHVALPSNSTQYNLVPIEEVKGSKENLMIEGENPTAETEILKAETENLTAETENPSSETENLTAETEILTTGTEKKLAGTEEMTGEKYDMETVVLTRPCHEVISNDTVNTVT